MIKRRTPQYPKEAFLEARRLKSEGFSYTEIIKKMQKKYSTLKDKKQAFRLVKYPIETIKEKT